MSGKGTLFGASSTRPSTDRGGVVLTAIAWYFAEKDGDAVAAAACVFVVLGSLMVSYTRAGPRRSGSSARWGWRPGRSAW